MGLRTWLGIKKKKPIRARATDYWSSRCDMLYYTEVRMLADKVAPNAASVIDVGSNGCPYLDWFDATQKVSVDLLKPYSAPDVVSVTADFIEYQLPNRFDLCLCLQVLEHVPDPTPFARKLLESAEHVIASVPYLWPAGSTLGHLHDPVDEEKMLAWFGRRPHYSAIVKENRGGAKSRRLICYYRTAPQVQATTS